MSFNPADIVKTAALVLLVCLASVAAGNLHAQQTVNIEELEKLLEEQQKALEEVESNREATEAQAQQAREALAEHESRSEKVKEEFEALCKEQEALKPGSLDDCMSAL
jgi:septal ring factor EnvC (AmiA/AmiB activator)